MKNFSMKNILKSSALWYAASAALFVYSFLTPHLIVQIVAAFASGWILMSLLLELRKRAKQKELQRIDESVDLLSLSQRYVDLLSQQSYVDSLSQRIKFAEERNQAAGPESSETAPESPKPTRKRSPRKPKKTADE
jgi:hypothetical protein